MLSAIFSSDLLYWALVRLGVLALATIGGIMVLIGIYKEHHSSKTWFSNQDDLKKQKSKGEWGYRLVMWGIGIETLIAAALALHDLNEISNIQTAIEKNDPLNQPLKSAMAIVTFSTEGTNDFNNLIHSGHLFSEASGKLAFGDPLMMSNGAPTMFSPIISRLRTSLISPGKRKTRWSMYFDKDEFFFVNFDPALTVQKAKDNWQKFEIGVPFLPAGAKILDGQILLTINDQSWAIDFSSQIVRGTNGFHAFWDNLTNGIAFFNETNSSSWLPR